MSQLPSATISAPLLTVNLLAAAVWVGSLAALAVATRAADETLDPKTRVAFFRALGRRYGKVGGLALTIAIGTGAGLVAGQPWTTSLTVLAALISALVVTTVVAVAQARRVNQLRGQLHLGRTRMHDGNSVTRHARRARLLRAAIALLTVAAVADVAVYLTHR